jgi:GNAT superfamily N-acetyltransferase
VTDPVALLAAYDAQLRSERASSLPPAARIDRDGPVVRVTGLHRGFVSTARDLGVRGAELDELIARQRDWFAARGEAFEWKTRGHDLPADLPARLRAAGFVPEERETVLIAPVAALPAHSPPPGVTIRQVSDVADMRRIAAMESQVWAEDHGWLAAELAGMVGRDPDATFVFAAEADGDVVSAAWLVLAEGTQFGGLWGGSTLERWRGRGLYRALVGRRAAQAAARGARYLQVDASDESRPILERLGFVAVTTTTPYVWSPAGARTAVPQAGGPAASASDLPAPG